MDVERALAKVRELASACDQLHDLGMTMAVRGGYGFDHPNYAATKAKADELIGPYERIARAVDSRLADELRDTYARDADYAGPKCRQVIGRLQSDEEIDEILGPTGPRLAAKDLHPWIWNAAVDLWSDGHYREAIQRAATALFDSHIPAKLGVHGKPGDLVSQAFSTDPPQPGKARLRLPGYQEGTESWTNAHEGAKLIGMGCVKAIRNLSTHDVDQPSEQEALEGLATLSMLARWVADAKPAV